MFICVRRFDEAVEGAVVDIGLALAGRLSPHEPDGDDGEGAGSILPLAVFIGIFSLAGSASFYRERKQRKRFSVSDCIETLCPLADFLHGPVVSYELPCCVVHQSLHVVDQDCKGISHQLRVQQGHLTPVRHCSQLGALSCSVHVCKQGTSVLLQEHEHLYVFKCSSCNMRRIL